MDNAATRLVLRTQSIGEEVPNTWRVENKGSLLTHGYEHGSCFDLEVDERDEEA
jgi:hypothetical protein